MIENVVELVKQYLQSEAGSQPLEAIGVLGRAPMYASDCPLPVFDSRLTNSVLLRERDESAAVRFIVTPGDVRMDVGIRRGGSLAWWYEHGLYQAGRFPGSGVYTDLTDVFDALTPNERLSVAKEIVQWALKQRGVKRFVHDFRPEAGAGESDLMKFFPR